MVKVLILMFLCNLFFFKSINAQEKDVSNIDLNLSYAQFRTENTSGIVEVYYSFLRNSLKHIKTGDKFVAKFNIELNIFKKDSLLKNISWQNVDELNDLSEIKVNQHINDLRTLTLPVDDYVINIKITDMGSNKHGEGNFKLVMRPCNINELFLSDIQLGLQISKTDKINRYVKNGFEVIPNPTSMYNSNWPILYFYMEIYNLSPLEDKSDSTYTVTANIKDSYGAEIRTIQKQVKVRLSHSVAEINKFFVGSLYSGSYTLNISVTDNKTNKTKVVSGNFFVSRPIDSIKKEELSNDALSDVFFVMTVEELDNEFDFARYIATSDEKNYYGKLNIEGKQKFLKNFWMNRNISNGNYRTDYLSNIKYADEMYSIGGKKGWRTDRGRILLKYGKPSKVELFNNQSKKYETWFYDESNGGIQFVFVDISGYGDLRLVHSTSLNEIEDYNWQSKWLK